jgi:methionine-rich copper-binding protein CopC
VHTHLVKAEPGVDSTVKVAPKQIRLWFNEAPEAALSAATLLKSDNSPVATVRMSATDDSLSVAGTIPVALEPGKYQVLWRTGSKDGHPVRGKYSFTFDPADRPKP